MFWIRLNKPACNRPILIFLFLLVASSQAFATPPSDLKLSYDMDKHQLHIEMTHVTTNQRDHHVRKIEIQKDDEPSIPVRFVKQTTSRQLIYDHSIELKSKDTVRVKALCNEAGFAKESLTIP
jgi:hypothetical protein